MRNLVHRFGEGGLRMLGRRGGYPAGRRRGSAQRDRLVLRLKSAGHANREIAKRLCEGLDRDHVRFPGPRLWMRFGVAGTAGNRRTQ